jgi:cytochrome c oxidase assembly protein subunit 15
MNNTSRKKIIAWLLCGCFFIFSMVVIGGITRLTGSGLSITEWNVVMGAIPPLNESQWNDAFEKYKEIPQYKKLNYDYSIADFKNIFFWEYLHRLIGRLIGIIFIVPFLYFYFTKQLDKSMIRKSFFLFLLGGLQGFLGWFMVKSGLTERTSVSHYRLAIHLVAAFITFAFTLWYALELIYTSEKRNSLLRKNYSGIAKFLFAAVLLQIIYGAFVAGLHAGKFANTFPTMDGEWIPSGTFSSDNFPLNFFENPVAVQFIHRVLASFILILISWLWLVADKKAMNHSQRKGMNFLLFAVAIQFLLGVFTLLSKAEITLASLHQIGAFILFSAVIFLLFHVRNNSLNTETH